MLRYIFSTETAWNILLVVLLVAMFIVTQIQRQKEKRRLKANFTVRNIWLNRVMVYENIEQYLYEMILENNGDFATIERIVSYKEDSVFTFQSTDCARDCILPIAFNVPVNPGTIQEDRIPPYHFTIVYRNRKGLIYRQSFKSAEYVKKK